MKTVQISYLESEVSKKWIDRNVSSQGKSSFIRAAVAQKIASLQKKKPVRKG